ncbi:hypothetical protein DRQ26_00310 [bacterium]|nr:MAG: hypothetical protein DRQ26_00310 [bacterium]
MDYRTLYIFIEGDDDQRFFQEIFSPELKGKYNNLKYIKYAQKSADYIKRYIRSILSMNGDYIFLTDINDSPCITEKKQKIQSGVKNIDSDKILVVVKEIESWYLAGLAEEVRRKFGIRRTPKATEKITKERFNKLIPENSSRIDFMREILNNFNIQNAKMKNTSFKYCFDKVTNL